MNDPRTHRLNDDPKFRPTPKPRSLAPVFIYVGVALAIVLFIVFPASLRLVEGAARQLRFLWWVVLILIFVLWLGFKFRRKK